MNEIKSQRLVENVLKMCLTSVGLTADGNDVIFKKSMSFEAVI